MLVVLVGLLAAARAQQQPTARRSSAGAISGFPCGAGQWLPANWTASSSDWVCQDCYVCARGEECLQRGGCVHCEDGHVDHDTDPTTRCEPCASGTAPAPDNLSCIEIGSNWLLLIEEGLKILAAVLSALLVVVAACCGQTAAEDGLHQLALWLYSTCCCCSRAKPPQGKKQLQGHATSDEESGGDTCSGDDCLNGGYGMAEGRRASSSSMILEPAEPQEQEQEQGEEETTGLLSTASGARASMSDSAERFETPRVLVQRFSAAAARLSPRSGFDTSDERVISCTHHRELSSVAGGGASPRHRRQRSVDSCGDFFSPSAALTDSYSSSISSSCPGDEDEYLSLNSSPRLEATSSRGGSGGDLHRQQPGLELLASDDTSSVAGGSKLGGERRNSAVWTPSPGLTRLRTV